MNRVADSSRAVHVEQLKTHCEVGRVVTLMLDGWENKSRKHIIGVILQSGEVWIVYEENGNYDSSNEHHGIAIAREMESLMEKIPKKYPSLNFGILCTDDAGQYARARRILAVRFPLWIFLHCFAHQINLIVKDVLNIGYRNIIAKASDIVNTFHKSSSKWLVRLDQSLKVLYGKSPALLSLFEIRWNSAQMMLASVLQIKLSLLHVFVRYNDDSDFPTQFLDIGDNSFWKEVKEAESAIRPLTKASFFMQRNQAKLSDVIMMYGRLYQAFGANATFGHSLKEKVECRFRKEEHPLLILSFFWIISIICASKTFVLHSMIQCCSHSSFAMLCASITRNLLDTTQEM